ncbi:MAG TPA: LCP family protein [Gaiellaceae bacterium]|nr:LCP family protein [Gaiellaceae bacterium]
MRTTLKRGTAGHVAGNGHGGNGIPLSPLTGATRYRTKRRGPLRVLGKFFLWLVMIVLVGAGALAGGAWLYINQSVAAVSAHSQPIKDAQLDLAEAEPDQPTVALVIGYDKRLGPESSLDSRSDTIMLMRADPQKDVISMMSFPRDLVVPIPGCAGQLPFNGRINEAYTYCGPRGTLKTVKELTGIPINYIITVNFLGFIDIVDKLGGVYVDVDHRYFNDNSNGENYATIDLHPGYQHLTGKQALDYARFRHTDSDLYRVVRQQNFVKAMKQQISANWSVTKIPGIVNTITKNVEVGVGGGKTLDVPTLYKYANLAYGLPSGNFQQVQIENITGYNELAASQQSIDDAVNKFMNPDVSAPEKAATAALGEKPKAEDTGPRPSQVSVEVLNGNGVAGAADQAAVALGERGYPVTNGGNADNFKYFKTTIFYDPAVAGAEAAAKRLADLFGDGEAKAVEPGQQLETMLQVVVGQTFHGDLASGPADNTPKHEPPAVTADSVASGVLKSVRKKAGFQLYTPTVRDVNSALSTLEPVREYKVGDHNAVRLTYETGAAEYWGIQEIAWDEPPILDGASVQRRIKGRDYGLYFDGAKLHMIAFRENGNSYYVVNTLLNRMSNETMLAIAKGLKPLSGN